MPLDTVKLLNGCYEVECLTCPANCGEREEKRKPSESDALQVARDKRSVPFPAFVSYLFYSFKARINNKSRGVGRQ